MNMQTPWAAEAAATMTTLRAAADYAGIEPGFLAFYEDGASRERLLADMQADIATLFEQRRQLADTVRQAVQEYEAMRRSIGGPHLSFLTTAGQQLAALAKAAT